MRRASRAQSEDPDSLPLSLRHVADLIVCLIIAVCLVRTFEVEGYMISTGSMAPGLLGYHKRVICPACGFRFPIGIANDESLVSHSDASAGPSQHRVSSELCTCPNCHQTGINVKPVPPNQGDQLLVHKNAYLWKSPRRWETVVFRNPARPTQAYVKRVAGLPGESVRIFDGELLVGGEFVHKNIEIQREMRIPVYDNRFVPPDSLNRQPRWRIGDKSGKWTRTDDGFEFRTSAPASSSAEADEARGPEWVVYQHAIRHGGRHRTTMRVRSPKANEEWQRFEDAKGDLPLTVSDRIRFQPATKTLTCVGVMPERLRERLLSHSHDPEFRDVVVRLAEKSHLAPITDKHGYNGISDENVVKDLALTANIRFRKRNGRFLMRMSTGFRRYECAINAQAGRVTLRQADDKRILRSAAVPPAVFNDTLHLEVSTFDRRFLVALNGEVVFDPWLETDAGVRPSLGESPVRFGSHGASVAIADIRLYRDVHYTTERARNAVDEPFRIGQDEYFVLGDNSQVSSDSRFWSKPAVSRRLLIGKPFLLHLPSRPGRLRIGGTERYVRIPDLPRVRYIH